MPLPFTQRVTNGLLWAFPDVEAQVPFIDKVNGLRARQRYELPRQPGKDFRVEYPSAGDTAGVHAADFAEYAALYEQAWSSQASRRVLGHLPSFMIFDDHEVTDDWNGDPGWLEMVHSERCAVAAHHRRVVRARLYQAGAICPGLAGDERVRSSTSAAKGRDARGLPSCVLAVKHGAEENPANDWQLPCPLNDALHGGRSADHRDVHGGGMSKAARRSSVAGRDEPGRVHRDARAVLMPSLPLFRHGSTTVGGRAITDLRRSSDIEHPAGNLVWDQIRDMIGRLQKSSTMLKTVVLISGDIHFSCNFDGQLKGSRKAPRLLQLISSGLQQRVSDEKQGQLFSAYKGPLNVVSQSKGVDEHRGIRITVGGMKRPGAKSVNFLFQTSVALVEVKLLPVGGDSRRGFMPLIKQASRPRLRSDPRGVGVST